MAWNKEESISTFKGNSFEVEFTLKEHWDSGYNTNVKITNTGDDAIENWALGFIYDGDIDNLWNGAIESEDDNHYVIKNNNYNSIIYAGHNIDFGYNGSSGSAEDVPENYKLYYYDLSKEKTENASDVENKEENNTENNQNIEEQHTDDAKPEEVDVTKDTDADGIPDYIEKEIGTDINKVDTDNDGLSDYFELLSMTYDPTKPDTDGNGINDGEEVNSYNTDPNKYDTDNDSVSDGKEAEIGTDPLVFNETFPVTVIATDEDTVKVSVKTELTGKQLNTLSVNRFNNDFLFPEDMPGYIGGAYEFTVDGEVDKATISFEFNNELLNDTEFDPGIYYFNEEEQRLEELETAVDGNVASTVTTHFSKYILLNRNLNVNRHLGDWADNFTDSTYLDREIVFLIDDSGWMEEEDPENKRLTIVENVINNADSRSKIGIFKSDTGEIMLSKDIITCDEEGKEKIKECLKFEDIKTDKKEGVDIFNSYGSARLYWGIDEALKYFSDKDDNHTMRCLVIITSGYRTDWISHSGTVNELSTRGVTTQVICFNHYENFENTFDGKQIKELATCTGGKMFQLFKDSSLDELYEELFDGMELAVDSDSDGIPDVYEDGFILFNGKSMTLDKNNPDTDGDGLLDGEEVKIEITHII